MLTTRKDAHQAGVSIDLIMVCRVRGHLPALMMDGRRFVAPADFAAFHER